MIPYAVNAQHDGSGIGIIYSDFGCPSQNQIANSWVIPGSPTGTNHSLRVGEILRATAPAAHITCGDWGDSPPLDTDLEPSPTSNSKPQAHVFNGSWGANNGTDRYLSNDATWDQFVYDERIFSTFAVGNTGLDPFIGNRHVGTPSKAFNLMSVGHHTDAGLIHHKSSYLDPETSATKPELMGPGVQITTPLVPDPDNGNSYSNPIIAGAAAIAIGAKSTLEFSPHLTKGVLLSAATRQLIFSGGGSTRDRMGEGGFNYKRIDDYSKIKIHEWLGASHSAYNWYASNDGGVSSNNIEKRVWIPQGTSVSAVLTWLNRGDYSEGQSLWHQKLGSGFNIYGFSPSGSYLGGSFDYFDSYAVFNFVANQSGWHTFWINREYQRDLAGDLTLGLVVNWSEM